MIASLMALGLAAVDCRHVGRHAYIRYAPVVARPGDRLTLSFEYRDGPDGAKPVPLRCVEKLRVRGRAALERNYAVRITNDAAAGSTVRVAVLIGGVERVADIVVTGRDEQVLTGSWSQRSAEHCFGRELAELTFSTDGGYSFTFPEQMVETMTSGSGRYRWDPATGALQMGNYSGVARRDGNMLTIEGIDVLAVPPPPEPGVAPKAPPPCRIVLTGG